MNGAGGQGPRISGVAVASFVLGIVAGIGAILFWCVASDLGKDPGNSDQEVVTGIVDTLACFVISVGVAVCGFVSAGLGVGALMAGRRGRGLVRGVGLAKFGLGLSILAVVPIFVLFVARAMRHGR
jgi:hypothetical protein